MCLTATMRSPVERSAEGAAPLSRPWEMASSPFFRRLPQLSTQPRSYGTRSAREGLEVRCGIHVGDIDRRGEDISGVTVAIAARLLALAGPGDILVTGVAAGATAGQGVQYQTRGEHQLKGVPGNGSSSPSMPPHIRMLRNEYETTRSRSIAPQRTQGRGDDTRLDFSCDLLPRG